MASVTAPIRVLLIDDDPLVRAGLRMILSSAEDLAVVGEVGDGSQALQAVREHRPDVVLMDIRMPEMDGISATQRLRELPEPPQIIVLTTFHLDEYVLRALRVGASGFLLKDTPPTEIVHAVRLVAAGEAMLSPSVTRTLLAHLGDSAVNDRRVAATARLASLSDREREVAVAVAAGASNADIAAQLYLSEATVKAYVSRLLAKLDAANRVQIAILVHDAGLVRVNHCRDRCRTDGNSQGCWAGAMGGEALLRVACAPARSFAPSRRRQSSGDHQRRRDIPGPPRGRRRTRAAYRSCLRAVAHRQTGRRARLPGALPRGRSVLRPRIDCRYTGWVEPAPRAGLVPGVWPRQRRTSRHNAGSDAGNGHRLLLRGCGSSRDALANE
jgi:DNA-binding NarL/FixJ family response regulator